MASAPIAATNKLSHRLSTLPVADFSASSNVKCRAQPARRGGRMLSEFRRATRLGPLTGLRARLNPFIEVVLSMDVDFVKSVSAGLEEAGEGRVRYTLASRLAGELEQLWNPPLIVREESVAGVLPSFEASLRRRASRAYSAPAPALGAAAPTKRPPPWFVGMSSAFSKDIVRIDRKLQGRILEALVEITENPTEVRGDTVKPLTGDLKGCWRYRVGDYRIIYSSNKGTGDITLLAFDARGSAYAA